MLAGQQEAQELEEEMVEWEEDRVVYVVIGIGRVGTRDLGRRRRWARALPPARR
jgi:mannitol/fructose-specific phosphotransferase system IIA component